MIRILFLAVAIATLVPGWAWPECGKRGPKSRVVGGHEASRGEWPWMAYLVHKNPASGDFNTCGATILSPFWVLTAGHCVAKECNFFGCKTKFFKLTVGQHDVNHDDKHQVTHDIEQIIKHEGFEQGRVVRNDIALLKMAKPIDFSNAAVGPACLPTADDDDEGSDCHISGWGFTMKSKDDQWDPRLQTVGAKVWKYEDCKKKWPSLHKATQICFGDGRVGACMGDSGGPISCPRKDGKYRVAGVTSFGNPECNVIGTPGVWTRVAGYVGWIQSHIGGGGGGSGGGCKDQASNCIALATPSACRGSLVSRMCQKSCGKC